jgi:hypothetical protein
MGRQAGGEAQEAEDDVLDPFAHVGLAASRELVRLLAARCSTTDTSCAPRLHSAVLVGAQLAEVQAVAVDVADVAELAGVGDLP